MHSMQIFRYINVKIIINSGKTGRGSEGRKGHQNQK